LKLENQNILIISNEVWGGIWYSKHNYADQLSKNNKVFFLNPAKPFRLTNIFKGIKEDKIKDNLTLIEYSNILPTSFFNFWKINDHLILKRLKKYFAKKNTQDILFWTFDPIRLAFPELLLPKKIILHAVDDYLFSFPSEIILAQKADYVFCVSETITTSYKRFNPRSFTIPHAIPDDEFLPITQQKKPTITALFAGKMDDRIDIEFTFEIFRSFPDIKFNIVGSVNADFMGRMNRENLNNVSLFPAVPSKKLKYLIQTSDFCFIFKKIFSGNNIFSHKLLQYLAQGKPIFGTEFSDFGTEMKNILYLSNNANEIKKMITAFCEHGEPVSRAEARINYARQHTFSKTFLNIEKLFKSTPSSRSYYYNNQVSGKTKFFNFLKKPLTLVLFDRILSNAMHSMVSLKSIIKKIIPSEYLYKKPSFRRYEKNNLKMNLDISNLIDHYIYFSFEDTAINNFIKMLEKNDTVIDIGANIGYVTLLFSKKCSDGKVISVEPSKKTFKTLSGHLSLNNTKNVIALNVGLGEKEKKEYLYQVNDHNTGMNRISASSNTELPGEEILIKSLDDLLNELKTGTINAIKLDVEGYEFNVLKGAHGTLKQFMPKLIIEVSDRNLREQGATPDQLFQFLLDLGYDIFIADSMEKLNLPQDFTNIHFDIICSPRQK